MIRMFRNTHSFLSNFYTCYVKIDGVTYKSVEHYYQSQKTSDPSQREYVREADTAPEAKKRGTRVTLRPEFDDIKLDIMYEAVHAKFSQSDDLRNRLIGTGDQELVEGNWWGDKFWGVCKGEGENHLGKILMRVREELRTSLPTRYFTGIGSRKTPKKALSLLNACSGTLVKDYNMVLRSGHAQGADRACEYGAEGRAHIYLPWPEFGQKTYGKDIGMAVRGHAIVPQMKDFPRHLATIREVYKDHGMDFDSLKPAVQKLMFRNVFQIHGTDNVLSELVICYHEGSGGTLWAVRLAERKNIPIINMKDYVDRETPQHDLIQTLKSIVKE